MQFLKFENELFHLLYHILNKEFLQFLAFYFQKQVVVDFELEFLREHLEEIRAIGFELEDRGNKVSITAIPLDLQHIDLGAFFADILSDISGYRSIRLSDLLKDKLASAACKAAVKGGMDLTVEEVNALFKLMDGNMGLKCPHGRPVVAKLTKTELEKMFKRIV